MGSRATAAGMTAAPAEGSLTIIIPVYNEEVILSANLGRLIMYLNGIGGPFEIILVSNGSTDMTLELAQQAQSSDPRVQAIALERRGVGRAFKAAARRAHYEHLVSVDMDLSVDLTFIEKARGLLAGCDLVVGSKQTGSQRRSWLRWLASATFISCARLLLGTTVTDYSIGAKGYRRSWIMPYLDRLDDDTAYVLQLVAWGRRDGARITEIPVSCEDLRRSKFNLLHEGIHKFSSLFLIWLIHHRRHSRP
ncbi:MAG: glycosyltransferase family 2 protein [candidate division NC10 bacterium]|nr:glycosyltransferase family 2 protein [candidate division NC10 bacterium]